MTTTHSYLSSEPRSSQILDCVEQFPYPGCLELRWDAPACGIVTEDTGFAFKADSRFIVMSLLKDQLRYYAASEDANDFDYEIGILPDAKHAWLFAEDYLVRKRELPAIPVSRNIILRASLKSQGDRVIERPNTDMQDRQLSRK